MAVAAVLAGCAHDPVPPVTTTVYVRVTEPCIQQVPVRPEYRTGQGPWPGDKAAAAILADDFEKAEQYGVQWEVAAIGCVAE